MNSDILLVMVVGRLFELNHSKSKINDTVLTCRATGFIDMQIHYVFQKDMRKRKLFLQRLISLFT